MDFFADGGFQQLFCDLNEQVEQDYNSWHFASNEHCNSPSYDSQMDLNISNNSHYLSANSCESSANYSSHDMALNEKHLQASLDYLLNNSSECLEFYDISSLTGLSKDLAEWEEKFLDNYIEIPELVDFLPEKTPLCTDNCNHFLQESAENLKLLPSPPNSPAVAADKTYTCTFGDCCKVYAKPAHLKAHLRRHLGEKPYICNWPNCTWRFSRSDELARHRRSHSGVKPYKCDFCAKCFARSDHLTKHRKVHERRLLAASKAGKTLENGQLPASVLTVRPGRKRKNQL